MGCCQPRCAVPGAMSCGEGAGLMAVLGWGADSQFMFWLLEETGLLWQPAPSQTDIFLPDVPPRGIQIHPPQSQASHCPLTLGRAGWVCCSVSADWIWARSTNPWGGYGGTRELLQFGLFLLKAGPERCPCVIGAGALWESRQRGNGGPAGKLGRMRHPGKEKGVGEVERCAWARTPGTEDGKLAGCLG